MVIGKRLRSEFLGYLNDMHRVGRVQISKFGFMSASHGSDRIPADTISLIEAFRRLYKAVTPNWELIDRQLFDESVEALAEALAASPNPNGVTVPVSQTQMEFDAAQEHAHGMLRTALGVGALTAYVRDPDTGERLRLTQESWDGLVVLTGGDLSNFVNPDDPGNPGPYTTVRGARRPIFFVEGEFTQWLAIACGKPAQSIYRTGVAGRPSAVGFIDAELERRAAAGLIEETLKRQGEVLLEWLQQEHPQAPPIQLRSVLNHLRAAYRNAKQRAHN
jgi:hypothetical protein